MKVVHISTTPKGGAANAAIRIHEALLKAGADSHFIFLFGAPANISNVQKFTQKISLLKRVLNRLSLYKYYDQRLKKIKEQIPFNYEIASLPYSDYCPEQLPLIKDADVINIHWPTGFISYPDFFKKLADKKIVWTVHDMNPFSGIFHYSIDTRKIQAGSALEAIDRQLISLKKESYKIASGLKFIGPSHWMKTELENSSIIPGNTVLHIPYCINQTFSYKPQKKQLRQKYQLPEDKTILLFVSESLENKRKGFDILMEAVKCIQSEEIVLCAAGKVNNQFVAQMNNKVYSLGYINNEEEMAEIYNACDCFLLPSRQDNLPNVMLEALGCGLPVISFKTGGMIDAIIDGFNGFLAPVINAENLSAAIDKFVLGQEKFDSKKISLHAHEVYAENLIAERYINEAYQ